MSSSSSSPPSPSSSSSLCQLHADLASQISESAKRTEKTIASKFGNAESLETSEGLSFLELKNNLMLDYLIDLSLVALKKSMGKKIQGDPSIDRIVEYRTYLEKMRPLESKLKYQIEKSVKIADSGVMDASDPLNFKPNPQNLLSKLDNEDEDGEEDDEGEDAESRESKDGLYKVPKNVPAYFDGDREEFEKESEHKERKKRMSQSLIEDLKRQHLDTPEEEFNMADTMRAKQIADYKERIRFEEENFIRMPMSKKEKHKNRQQRFSTVATLGDELTSFGTNLFEDNDSKKKSSSKKRKAGSFKKGAAKKKFRRK